MKNRFVFKIWSGYDGFRPDVIPTRKQDGLLSLGWTNYIDEVDRGDVVWVYFHGPGVASASVYVKGTVSSVDRQASVVYVRPSEESTTTPLIDEAASDQVAQVVQQRGRQVFAMPLELAALAHGCDLDSGGASCLARNCGECPNWRRYPLIEAGDYRSPGRLKRQGAPLVPAYWIIPRRCYLGGDVAGELSELTRHFTNLKTGDRSKSFPFAWGVSRQLEAQGVDVDEVVAIPLSPDKESAGEKPRAKLLAQEVARLIEAPFRDRLRLARPISKRRPPWSALSTAEFENAYHEALEVLQPDRLPRKVLLIDDVCTRGSTVAAAIRSLREVRDDVEVVVATAGLMVVKETVIDDRSLRRRSRSRGRH